MTEPTNEELAEALRSIEGLPLGTRLVVRLAADRLCADGGGWIEWGGGECPVPPETVVEVKYRDGERDVPGRMPNKAPADEYYWGDNGNDSNIISYRVIRGAP